MSQFDRDSIKNGYLQSIAKDAVEQGLITLSTDEEREASWRATLASNPNADGSVWIFAYGSLLWNPAFHLVEKMDAYLNGYHRDFCLRTYIGRGTPEQPGLVLGLEQGGHCHGQALRMDPSVLEEELSVLWSREMLTNAYCPRWEKLGHKGDQSVYAVCFVMDQNYSHYVGNMSFAERCYDLAHGAGPLGSAAEYLFDTVSALEKIGLTDSLLEDYVARVHLLQTRSV